MCTSTFTILLVDSSIAGNTSVTVPTIDPSPKPFRHGSKVEQLISIRHASNSVMLLYSKKRTTMKVLNREKIPPTGVEVYQNETVSVLD